MKKRGYKKLTKFEVKTECRDLKLDVYINTDNGGFLIELDGHDFKGADLKELKKQVEKEANTTDSATFHPVIEYDIHDRWQGYRHTDSHCVQIRWRAALVSHQRSNNNEAKPRLEKPSKVLINPDTNEACLIPETQHRWSEDEPLKEAKPHPYNEWYQHSIEFTSERYLKLKYVSDGIDRLNQILDDVLGGKDQQEIESRLDGLGQLLLPPPEPKTPPEPELPDPVIEQAKQDIHAHFEMDPEFAKSLAAEFGLISAGLKKEGPT